MANLLHTPRTKTSVIPNLAGRNYDYTNTYNPDKLGEEAKENARVWNVYLDEAENHDADMIEGFRNIIDGLLVFAALFSAVVTTFVAQTSQALQPDNAQIMVYLLIETNQLLRAAGNRTSINALPIATLGPESRTYTSIDVWVNGLFFTSLALSLSTALLSVLAKQWIQAYTATVPGDAKARALTRQFRFEGLMKWKLSDFIESLPLILHCSVAVFLVGLALYVSQLSGPICGVVAGIAALTFLFYFGSSILPAYDIGCPYRIPFMFPLAQLLIFAIRITRWKSMYLWWYMFTDEADYQLRPPPLQPLWEPMKSLKMAERNRVLEKGPPLTERLAHNSFGWLMNYSSNHSVKEVVIEGTCGLLNEWCSDHGPTIESLKSSSENSFLRSAIVYSLSKLSETCLTSSMEDNIGKTTIYGRLIVNFMKAFSLRSLLEEPTNGFDDWQIHIKTALIKAYATALREKNHMLSRVLLVWGSPNLLRSDTEWGTYAQFWSNTDWQSDTVWNESYFSSCVEFGDAESFRDLLAQGIDLNFRDCRGWTALHAATRHDNLDVVIALVEQGPTLISATAGDWMPTLGWTPLEFSIKYGTSDVVTYLLDHGAKSVSHNALYDAVKILGTSVVLSKVELLLDCGWDRTIKDADGKTLLDVARSKGSVSLVEYLEHYQTVRFPPWDFSHCV